MNLTQQIASKWTFKQADVVKYSFTCAYIYVYLMNILVYNSRDSSQGTYSQRTEDIVNRLIKHLHSNFEFKIFLFLAFL
jgi:uncharacterized Fe-S cluster-containing radical SAM superfamily protein